MDQGRATALARGASRAVAQIVRHVRTLDYLDGRALQDTGRPEQASSAALSTLEKGIFVILNPEEAFSKY